MRFGAFALPQADGDIIPARAGVRHVSSTEVLMQRHEDAYQDQYRCLQAAVNLWESSYPYDVILSLR